MAEPKHLWEVDHPYYMETGCFYTTENHAEYESFAEFLDTWGDLDLDMNLVFRWDWKEHQPYEARFVGCEEEDHSDCSDILSVFFIMQRKAYPFSTRTKVSKDDEPAVLKYLTPRARRIALLWEPIWQGGAA